MKNFTSTKLFRVILIVIFFGSLILISPIKAFNPFRNVALAIFSPFQKVSYVSSMKWQVTKEFLLAIGDLKKENEQLREKNLQLLAENAKFHDIEKENALLPRDKFELTAALVISQDYQSSGNWIEISKGSEDGLADGMPVIVSKGVLIGKLQEVTDSTARVLLLSNPKSSINAMTSTNEAKGILKGEYGLGIILDMILQTDSVSVGDEIVTSGISGSIPRGLYIGTVQEIHPSEDHLFQQAVVASPIQASKLQTVFVVTQTKK